MTARLRFSANLGFLWTELALPDAIRRAKAAGFQAVEFQWPYETDAGAMAEALRETGLPVLSLNTRKGNPGEFGLSALPDREEEAREAIEEAFAYADKVGAGAIHVMAGIASAGDVEPTQRTFDRSLHFACDLAERSGRTVLIEPLNARDAPGYVLRTIEQAATIVSRVDRPSLRILFDCYHVQIEGGDLLRRFQQHRARIGHIQFAAVPSRTEPDEGEVAYDRLLPLLVSEGWNGFFGAEYRPREGTDAGLGWKRRFEGHCDRGIAADNLMERECMHADG
ncbi:TIM barrel protein [Aureimonas sp. ME7]|uniref:hydroxypyruvate isomerase family protein n=1 Tax=Aureimonas sp. ME7 TaxID=2744252 RepID=UPI0015FCCF78|nr:TIM barrel protein [Aureimonas sp. ME7]